MQPEQHGSPSYLFRAKAINNPGIGHTHATLHRGDLLPKFRADRMDQVGSKISGNNMRTTYDSGNGSEEIPGLLT